MIWNFAISVLLVLCIGHTVLANDSNGIKYNLERINNSQVQLSVMRNSEVVQKILFGEDFGPNMAFLSTATAGTTISGNGMTVYVTLTENNDDFTLFRVTRTVPESNIRKDCISLQSNQMSWFGGPQQKFQYWPIEKLTFDDYSYVTKEMDNCGIAERYWLNSHGSFVYVEQQVPLFLEQNINGNDLCLIAKKQLPYDTHTPGEFSFNYYIGVGKTARDTHMAAIQRFLMKPTGFPAENMVRNPIWSTWTRYYRDIDENVVRTFANEIVNHNFTGQFEIDDDWEICYGALTFRESKFPNIRTLTTDLKALGFTVTLWTHPFINKACEPYYSNALSNEYLVRDFNGSPDTHWWNSDTYQAAYVDFTNPNASKWFTDHLIDLRTSSGVDGFKFDAGETSWAPPDPRLVGIVTNHPNTITTDFVRAVAAFGPLSEVRSGWLTQDLPIFVRMLDKDSRWSWNNGLPTLVTTLLQLNMVGYPLVLPDMIGGNGYDDSPPDKEMFIRWLQASVFMPSLQFSFVPWQFDDDTVTISKKYTDLHAAYTELIMTRFALAVSAGEPVNPPMWWISPSDRTAHQIDDQYLLGETILAAPVLRQGQITRHVYLTEGTWRDGNTGTIYTGPKWLMDYPAPLDTLPYFIKNV